MTRKSLASWLDGEVQDELQFMHLKDLIKCHRPEILPAITEQQCPGHYSWFIAHLVKISLVSSLVPSAGGSRGSYSIDKGTSLETLRSKNAPQLPKVSTVSRNLMCTIQLDVSCQKSAFVYCICHNTAAYIVHTSHLPTYLPIVFAYVCLYLFI